MDPSQEAPKTLLSLLRLDSIRNRILVLALLATLVPALSTALVSFERARRALTETLESELRRAGSQTARELDLWEKERTYDLRVFVGSFEVTENLPRISGGGSASAEALTRLTDYLTGIQNRFLDYAELRVTDVDGGVVTSSRADDPGSAVPAEWLQTLERGESVVGDPQLDASYGVVTQIAVPVLSSEGRFLGALVATLSFTGVGQILRDFVPGDGGRIDLITEDARRIASSAGRAGLDAALDAETRSALTDAAGTTLEYADTDDVQVVGLLTGIPRVGWSVLVQVPTEEAYARISQLRRTTVLLVSVLLIFVGVAAYFIGLLIVRPLDRLTAGASAVAAGDLSVDLPVTGRDEVAMLTQVFNGMVGQLRASRQELERISITDALTSLPIRRHVISEFKKELRRAKRHDRPVAVLMLDIDAFKAYNDTWGHQAGDDVLRRMGAVLRDATREADVPGRYGGEEFIVVLPDCDVDGAVATAERVRERLDREEFDGRKVTVSIGASAFPVHGTTPEALIGAADVALYQAKNAGRDRVIPAGVEAGKGTKPAGKPRPEDGVAPEGDSGPES